MNVFAATGFAATATQFSSSAPAVATRIFTAAGNGYWDDTGDIHAAAYSATALRRSIFAPLPPAPLPVQDHGTITPHRLGGRKTPTHAAPLKYLQPASDTPRRSAAAATAVPPSSTTTRLSGGARGQFGGIPTARSRDPLAALQRHDLRAAASAAAADLHSNFLGEEDEEVFITSPLTRRLCSDAPLPQRQLPSAPPLAARIASSIAAALDRASFASRGHRNTGGGSAVTAAATAAVPPSPPPSPPPPPPPPPLPDLSALPRTSSGALSRVALSALAHHRKSAAPPPPDAGAT